MPLVLRIIIVFGIVAMVKPSSARNWMKEYEKTYGPEEIIDKFAIYLDNHRLVENLNKIYEEKTEFKLNSFADLSPQEFKSKILARFPRSKNSQTHNSDNVVSTINSIKIPDSFDWRDKGVVTPIKDQGSVGTCWAFSAVENLEGAYALRGNNLTALSVEQIVDCDGTYNATTGNADCGVNGGWPFLGGITAEKDYPYCVGLDTGSCSPCAAPGYNKTICGPPDPSCIIKDSCQAKVDPKKFVPNLKVSGWIQTTKNETDIQAQLLARGPLSVALNAQHLPFYNKGILNPKYCDPTDLNHAVLMVGWGIEKSKPFWIIKNSWGEKWGEKGYFRIARGVGKCGINTQVVSALLQ